MPFESNSTEHDSPTSSSIASAAILAIAVLWCVYWFVHAWHYLEDDAYIHLEFARSVAAGQGFSFNGHVVAGDTAPLWVFLLVGMHTLIPNWLVASKVLTVFGAVVGLTGAFAFARNLASSMGLPRSTATLFAAAIVLLIVVNPYTCYWIFSGMEPIAASGLACFAVLAATRARPSTGAFLLGCLLAGIGPLVRPEMIFLTGLLALPLLGQWFRLPGPSTSAARLGGLFAGFILIAGPIICWSIYSLHAFGHLLPNTNAAKRAGLHDSVIRHLLSIYSLAFPLILCGLVAGIVYLFLRPSDVRRSLRSAITSAFTAPPNSASLPLAGWIVILWPSIAAVFYVVNHTYVQTRYILATAPTATIVILLVAFTASRVAGRVLYIAALLSALVISVFIVRPFVRNKGISCAVTRNMAHFMRDDLPLNAPVAVYSIGQIAFESEHPIVDTGGITRPGAIPYLNDPLSAMVRWAHTEGAQYYITDKPPEPGATLVYITDQPFIGWTFHTSLYSTSARVGIWKLATPSGPLQQPESSRR